MLISTIRAWLKDHPRIGWGCIGIVLLVLAFVAGRFTTPVKTVTITQTVHATHDEKKTEQKTEQKREAVVTKNVVHTVIVYRDKIIHPDGTVELHRKDVTTDAVKDEHKDLTASAVTAATTVVHDDVQSKTVKKEVTATGGALSVSLMLGMQLNDGLKPVVGVGVEHQIIGQLSGGLWGTINVSGPLNPALGGSLTLRR